MTYCGSTDKLLKAELVIAKSSLLDVRKSFCSWSTINVNFQTNRLCCFERHAHIFFSQRQVWYAYIEYKISKRTLFCRCLRKIGIAVTQQLFAKRLCNVFNSLVRSVNCLKTV